MASTVVLKPLPQDSLGLGYRYHKLRKTFSFFIAEYNVSLKKLLQQGISELEFYGDLVYRIRQMVGKSNAAELIRKLINR